MNAPAGLPKRKDRTSTIIAVIVLLAAAVFQFAYVNQPFERNAEGCGAFFGLLARNYFRYPFAISHGIPIMSDGRGAPPVFYANHPPTTPLVIAGVMRLAGYRGQYDVLPPTWTIRLPTILATLACGWTIFVLMRNRAGGRVGVLAAALFFSLPMTLMYGGFPDVISPMLCLGVLLTLAAYERLIASPRWRNGLLACAAFTTAGIVDWPAFYLLPVLAVHCLCTQPRRRWPIFIGLGLFGVALFLAEYAYLTTEQPSWRWMITQLAKRSASHAGDYTGEYTFGQWCKQALRDYAIGRHTLVVPLLAMLWIIEMAIDRFRSRAARLPGLLLAWAALHVLIGRQGVYQHEWWWWPISPPLAIAAAFTLEAMIEYAVNWTAPRMATAAVALCLTTLAARNALGIIQERAEPSLIEPGHTRGSPPGPMNYTLVELGQVVRDHVPADTVYLISESDLSLASWYYCDRAVRRNIWDVATFENRKASSTIDLSFDLPGSWNAQASRMIVPKIYFPYTEGLRAYLDQRYLSIDLPKFVIFDLTRSK